MTTGPVRGSGETPGRSRLATAGSVFALVMFLMLAGALLLVLPLLGFIGIAILVGTVVFGGMIAAQYLIWGRWMKRMLDKEDREP